jgi:hypothetical protein
MHHFFCKLLLFTQKKMLTRIVRNNNGTGVSSTTVTNPTLIDYVVGSEQPSLPNAIVLGTLSNGLLRKITTEDPDYGTLATVSLPLQALYGGTGLVPTVVGSLLIGQLSAYTFLSPGAVGTGLFIGSDGQPQWLTPGYPPGHTTTGSGPYVLQNNATINSPNMVTPVLGTVTSGNIAACTGYPITAVTLLGANVATFLQTPTSANLRSALAGDSSGTGVSVFSIGPTISAPTINSLTTNAVLISNAGGIMTALQSGGQPGLPQVLQGTNSTPYFGPTFIGTAEYATGLNNVVTYENQTFSLTATTAKTWSTALGTLLLPSLPANYAYVLDYVSCLKSAGSFATGSDVVIRAATTATMASAVTVATVMTLADLQAAPLTQSLSQPALYASSTQQWLTGGSFNLYVTVTGASLTGGGAALKIRLGWKRVPIGS